LSVVSLEDDFEETSLVIATEDLNKVKPKNKRSRQMKALSDIKKEEKKSKKNKNLAEGQKPKKKRSVITAYMLWSKEHRSKIQQTCPDMDFANVSKKLGEIWQAMPKNEKTQWKRKAQKLAGNGSSLISTGKPKISTLSKIKSKMNAAFGASRSALNSDLLNNDDYSRYASNDEVRPIGTTPIDVSAHLRLLGESLTTIGQRLKEHSGQIAVSGSLSVLLDSTLCAIGPLLCLTKLDPKMDGCSHETHKKTLDNIAYIMPGI
jgi:high mobility group protein 2-like 1